MKKKNTIYAVISILVVACLVTVGVFSYLEYSKIKDEATKESEKIIDNRISPDTNQGLILEISRIRHRGLLDEIVKTGTGWKNKPQFYFISNIDSTEYISKNVKAAGAESEILFNTWDTIFQENKIMEDTKDGQEKSLVKLTIVERVSSGLLGLRTQDVVKEEIEVTYDYRTGRWDGKGDSFMDSDGYGHYLGETFEVWFNIYQTSADHDDIPYWTEVNILGTDPRVDDSNLDPDNDGIPTSWEWKWGYDPHTWDDHRSLDPDVDGIENIEEYQMQKWFSNPFQQDIYIESDGMERGGLFDPPHVFYEESAQILIERFAQHGINVYIDNGWPDGPKNGGGELLPHVETISQDSGMILQFYKHHFDDERKGIFRYMLTGHNTGFCHPSVSNKYDTIAIDSSLKKLVKRLGFTPRTQRILLAGAAMHELGHSQGLGSWTFAGIDNRTIYDKNEKDEFLEKWSGYKSVMNYNFIFDKKLLDYSNGDDGPPYDQNDWGALYLPTFQIDAEVIEGPNYADLVNFEEKKSAMVNKDVDLTSEDWEYDEEITEQFRANYVGSSPVAPIEVEWFVLVKTDAASQLGDRDARVYAKPIVYPTYSGWTLSWEGCLDDQNNVEVYSIQNEVERVMQQISEMGENDEE